MSGIYVSGQWEGVYLFMPMCICVQDPDDCKWKYLVQDSEPGVLRATSLPHPKARVGRLLFPGAPAHSAEERGKP